MINSSILEIKNLSQKITQITKKSIKIMEVCGTHTVAVARTGLRSLFPEGLSLISGPGCPVCVTSINQIDQMVSLAREPNTIIATFGDMLRVPGSDSSLDNERIHGADIRVIYSAMEALELALNQDDKKVILLGIGFETTSPTIAATIIRAKNSKIDNFFVYPAFKLIPPALQALLENEAVAGEVAKKAQIDGFMCPGHVSTIIGSEPYEQISRKYHIPCVIAGFEAIDIIECIVMILKQIKMYLDLPAVQPPKVEIQYKRAVSSEGNLTAKKLINQVFQITDAEWRGLGVIPNSGLTLSDKYTHFDIRNQISLPIKSESVSLNACRCGEIMQGLITPLECPLFAESCLPSHPLGPCMVSSEGACAAYYKYGKY